MQKVFVYSILKKGKDEFETINKHYMKLISKYADIQDNWIYTKQIDKAQKEGERQAQAAYGDAFSSCMKGVNIVLDPGGKELDSEGFSRLVSHDEPVAFFIGGAYGFDDTMRAKASHVISLSRLTMSHKLARSVLFEQIYRAFTIVNNHPYHK